MAKAHSLIRIKEKLVNTPHLIDQQGFDSIMTYVNGRIDGTIDAGGPEMVTWADADGDFSYRYNADTATGVMHIEGPLTYRTSGWEAVCGGTSYEMLKDQMEYFVSQGAKTVAWMVDSGGGEAHGMIDSAKYLRKLADENGIKIITYVDGMSASAAYGLSAVSDEIIMSSDSQVGSIGVLIQLMNNSKMLEKAGIERTFITAGEDKVPFDDDGAFTQAFKDRLQESVDALYEDFTAHVANGRGIELSVVKGTEANVFMAKDALALGLADKVMTVEEFYDYLATVAQNNLEGKQMGSLRDTFRLSTKGDAAEMAKLDEVQALLAAEQSARAAADEALATQMTAMQAMQTQLDELLSAKAAAETAAAEAKLEARKAALAEVIPAAELETKFASYAALDDAMFAFMVGELGAAKEARAKGFEAIGQDEGELDADDDKTVDAHAAAIDQIRQAGIERAKALKV